MRARAAAGRRRVRLPELVLGILLVAGGALGAVLWATHEPSQRVLVAARAIQRGETIDGTMVRWAVVSGDHIAGLDATDGLAGRIAALDIVAGSPLQDVSFREPTVIGADQIEYGLALDAGDYPVGLGVGDHVVVVVVAPPDSTGAAVEPVTLADTAEVLVAPSADLAPGQKAVVNLLVDRGDAAVLAAAADVKVARVSAATSSDATGSAASGSDATGATASGPTATSGG